MVKIAQIKGPSGSGKSTIVKQMLDDNIYYLYDGKKPCVTVFPTLQWAAIGPYKIGGASTSNGCDSVGKVQLIKDYILCCLEQLPEFNIVFEGAMISTITSTFYDYLLDLKQDRGIEPYFVLLQTTPEKCIERMAERGSLKPNIDVQRLTDRCEFIVNKALQHYNSNYIRILKTDAVEQSKMLETFLELVRS